MSKSTTVIFKRSLLAAAVVSLSACSTAPKTSDLSVVGEGIVKAGKVTADVTRKTWNHTTYLLGFTDAPGDDADAQTPSDEQLLIAQEDVGDDQVLPLADASVDEPATTARPAVIQQATAVISDDNPAEDITVVANDPLTSDPLAPSANDAIHEVAEDETLWDIAKLTTGDANNWHVLADVNNLEQSATVFPGQQLIIPGDIVKEEYAATLAPVTLTITDDKQGVESTPDEEPVIAAASDVSEGMDSTDEASLADAANDTQGTVVDLAADTSAQLASAEQNATSFELNDGETLWDFAKRTTGDATNWQAIASQNNFTEKQSVTVRPGQTIFVPQSLVKEGAQASVSEQATDQQATEEAVIAAVTETPAETAETASDTLAAAMPTDESLQDTQAVIEESTTENSSLTQTAAVSAEDSVLDESSAALSEESSLDETQPVAIVEATYKSDDSLNPVNADDETAIIAENDNIPAQIVVSGTYYPKAVYNDADFSSSLLMRVSPGTTLQVSRAMGTWFEVETAEGVGYVHQRDIR